MDLKKLGEFGFIRQLARSQPPLPRSLRVGIGDDTCVWSPAPGFDLLATADLLIEKNHFSLKTTTPWQLGAKALAASLSDIAAKGGLPRFHLVSLSIPRRNGRKELDSRFFDELYAGMQAWGSAYGSVLAGGDTTASPGPLVVDVMCLGEVERGRAILRSGARPGDLLLATGTLGDSGAGLACLQASSRLRRRLDPGAFRLLTRRHLAPRPRTLAGRWLCRHRAATASIDVSDGLSSEIHHLAEMSGVGFEVFAEQVPLSTAARSVAPVLGRKALDWALSGGEDYELLFTVPPAKAKLVLRELTRETGTPVAVLGRALPKSRGVTWVEGRKRRPLKARGYDHFAKNRHPHA
jgi:thiamine-monophosphate kinase